MKKLLCIVLICVTGSALTSCIGVRHYRQPNLLTDGYGWHWNPFEGKHWHYSQGCD